MQVDWELSQSFVSDSTGVRSACVLPAAKGSSDVFQLVTGNQAGRLCAFGVPSADMGVIPFQHDHAVTAILSNPSTSSGQQEDSTTFAYVTGCKDAVIRIFDSAHQLVGSLKGHEKPVTSLAWCGGNKGGGGGGGEQQQSSHFLVSGSWDGTAKVWNMQNRSLVATLPGHENSVCVASLSTSSSSTSTSSSPSSSSSSSVLEIVTGSAGIAANNRIQDHSIRIWNVDTVTGDTKLKQTVANDHEGPIRDVCFVPLSSTDTDTDAGDANTVLASCSNDGTVKFRSRQTAEASSTLSFMQQSEHPPMLLSVASIHDGPSLAAAAEDGHVIVWDLAAQQQDSDSDSTDSPQPPQIIRHVSCVWKVLDLPNGDFATCCDDGTVRIFTRATERQAPLAEREAFAAQAQAAVQKQQSGPSAEEVAKLPSWSDNAQHVGKSEGQVQLFQKDGTAIAAQWSAPSRTWIEVGQVMGSNPQDQGMIEGVKYDHVLPIEVDQTGGGVASLQIGYNNGENCFVAAQRFIDAHELPRHHLQQIADYIQQRLGQQSQTLGASGTGSGGPAGMAPTVSNTGTPIASFEYLPIKGYKTFDLAEKVAATTLEKMKNKIQEFGKLSDGEMAQVVSLMTTLAASNRYHASQVPDSELNVISHMLTTFPPAEAFPALDLAKLAALHPDAASTARFAYWDGVIQQALALCQNQDALQGPAAVAIPMLSLRLFANAFKGGPGSAQAVAKHSDDILACVEAHVQSSNKNIRLSVATVLHNACCYVKSNAQTAGGSAEHRILPMLNTIITSKTYESEAMMRALVALGTLVMSSKNAKEAAQTLFLASKVELAASPHGTSVKSAAKEVYAVLQ
jgi:phospholipase A-2-activating protein